MKRIKIIILFILFSSISLIINAQTKLNQWREHLSYASSIKLIEANNKIYNLTTAGLFYYSRIDGTLGKINKISGLSDYGIKTIAYNEYNKTIILAYKNGNIDFIIGNNIYNIADIKNTSLIIGSKAINEIVFVENDAYLACDFGIVLLDMENREIKDTYFIGESGQQIKINSITIDDNHNIYVGTKNNILTANIDNDNLVDFNVWKKLEDLPLSIQDKNIEQVLFWDNRLFTNVVDTSTNPYSNFLHYRENNIWNIVSPDIKKVSNLVLSQDKLLILSSNEFMKFLDKGTYQIQEKLIRAIAIYAIYDKDNNLWLGDIYRGMRTQDMYNYINIYACSSQGIHHVLSDDGKIFTVSGGVNGSWGGLYKNFQISRFQDENWFGSSFVDYRDAMQICINPNNKNQIFVSSWGYGVTELDNDLKLVMNYNESNSSLKSIYPGASYMRIMGLAFDNYNNLFVTNSGVEQSISVKTPEDKWYGLSYPELKNIATLAEMIVTEDNNKWIRLPRNDGLFVFNERNTLSDQSDDYHKKLDLRVIDDSGEKLVNKVNAIKEDKNGIIWIGTNEGIVIYTEPYRVFEDGFQIKAQRIKIEIDENVNYLLKSETVTSIAIDGGNRKWIGTEGSGVYLISEDGTNQLKHFDIDNSPLISNHITSIAVDGETGEVFFGSSKGLMSYKDVATEGNDNFSDVFVYPNPVRPEYEGDIIIKGLLENTNVKITDISSNIVFETTSMGGQAVWNGKRLDGKKPHTGVYLVFCSNEDGSKTKITKLLFIN